MENSLCDYESAAHASRVAELSRRLSATLNAPAEQVFELCDDFDQAVEFATLEGRPVAEAIADFIGPRAEMDAPPRTALADLTIGEWRDVDIFALPLPAMPRHLSRLLRTADEETSAGELDCIASADPVLTGALLGAANLGRFGRASIVVRTMDAVKRLGVPETRRVLLTSSIGSLFEARPLRLLWKHSMAVAQVAFDLAEMAGLNAQHAWVAGLLHDIGRLGLMQLPARLKGVEQAWLAAGFPVAYAEALTYGIDHAAVGAEILRRWKLPEELIEAVGLHNRPEHARAPLNAVIFLAQDLISPAANALDEDLWPTMRRITACRKAGISIGELESFRMTVREPVPASA